MNGDGNALVLWLLNALAGAVLFLLGVVLKMHRSNDDERFGRLTRELEDIRRRLADDHGEDGNG